MKTNHIVSRKANTITAGTVTTNNFSADVKVVHVDSCDNTVMISIENRWFDADDLRETAKLFKKMADVLDAQ